MKTSHLRFGSIEEVSMRDLLQCTRLMKTAESVSTVVDFIEINHTSLALIEDSTNTTGHLEPASTESGSSKTLLIKQDVTTANHLTTMNDNKETTVKRGRSTTRHAPILVATTTGHLRPASTGSGSSKTHLIEQDVTTANHLTTVDSDKETTIKRGRATTGHAPIPVATTTASCNGCTLEIQNMNLVSPYYPFQYHNFMCCLRLIVAPIGARISLTFSYFDLEVESTCSYDYVEIFDGSSSSDPSLSGRLCGSAFFAVFHSPHLGKICSSNLLLTTVGHMVDSMHWLHIFLVSTLWKLTNDIK